MYKIEDLLKKATAVHRGKYTYDESTYVKMTEKMRIICPIHGEFWQSLHQHINKGQGCPCCGRMVEKDRSGGKNKKMSSEEYFFKCKEKFGEIFRYEGKYKNLGSNLTITCPKHGTFIQNAYVHLNSKFGCPKCSAENLSINFTSNTNEFIKKAKEVHGNKYDYSKSIYTNVNTPICIICPVHGEFWQLPYNHLSGNGCPTCGMEKTTQTNTFTLEDFIEKANQIHNNKYDYSKSEYVNYKTKICIICPVHGEFWQTPDDHLQGKGCKKCGNLLSKAENEIYEMCCNLLGRNNVIQSDRSIISPQELDIYIPSLKIGIEYNGLRWHSEEFGKDKNYHLEKLLKCQNEGIRLIQIFEDEYFYHKDIVLSKIKHLLKRDNLPKIMGRKCIIKEVDFNTSKGFLNKYHIQGYARSSIYLGAYYNNELIAIMTFKKGKNNKWELTRYASNHNYICEGVGGKLFKYFIRNYEFSEIKSFADRRWTINEDNLYTKLGFKKKCYLEPDYHYISNSESVKRYHKFGFRKQILHKKYGLPLSLTEKEMTKQMGYSKIWDCGLIKYVYKKEEL